MRSNAAFLVLITLLLGAPCIHAAEEGAAPPNSFSGEPPPSGPTARLVCAAIFQALDANEDGFVSADEATKSPRTMEDWKLLDSDRDNRISFKEFCAGIR
jgi:EF hand